MNASHKSHVKWASLLLCLLALTLFLAACGNTSDTGGTTTAPTPTPTPTPTPNYTSPDGYTLTYSEQSWKKESEGTVTEFQSKSDPTTKVYLPPAAPGVTPDTYLTTIIKTLSLNIQLDTTTTNETIGGETWKKTTATGDYEGQQVKVAILTIQHGGKVYVIVFVAKASNYDQAYNADFKVLVASYKFTS